MQHMGGFISTQRVVQRSNQHKVVQWMEELGFVMALSPDSFKVQYNAM